MGLVRKFNNTHLKEARTTQCNESNNHLEMTEFIKEEG
jgi:hypothetical protein